MKNIKLEELELDNFIEKIDKSDIEVSEKLDERINNTINNLKPKKHYFRNTMVASILLLVVIVSSIRFSSGIYIYASEIPGLKTVVDFIRGDKGIQNAVDHGYKEIPGVTIEENGYILKINDIYMDEDRITFDSIIEGESVNKLQIESESKEQNTHDIDYSRDNTIDIRYEFTDFEGGSVSQGSTPNYFLRRKVERTFHKIGEVKEFLELNPESLNLRVTIYKGKEVVYEFNNIKIPIDKENIMLSKEYDFNQEYVFDYGKIDVKKLTINPTRMRLDLNIDMKEDYFITGFENHYLKDDKGNIYKPEGLISTGSTSNKVMYFVPSIYFDEAPKKLYFCFDGIRIGKEEGREFRLSLEDKYPKIIKYMDEEIIIKDVILKENKKLIIISQVLSEDKLKYQSLNLIGNKGYTAWSEHTETDKDGREITYKKTSFGAEKQEYYDIIIEFPGYLIPLDEEIELK